MSKPCALVRHRKGSSHRAARVLQEYGQEWLWIHSPHSYIETRN